MRHESAYVNADPRPLTRDRETAAEVLLTASGLACFRGERLLFSGLDLELGAGQALQIHGANGTGKTTLLRLLSGLMLPTDGEVRWRGNPIRSVDSGYHAESLYVGHAPGVKLELTALENLRFASGLDGRPTGLSLQQALQRVNLHGFEDMPTRNLSAGQRRRIALARLLVTRATLWILDEPFTSLDRAGTAMIEGILHEHLSRGGMGILTSHQPLRVEDGRGRELHLGV